MGYTNQLSGQDFLDENTTKDVEEEIEEDKSVRSGGKILLWDLLHLTLSVP